MTEKREFNGETQFTKLWDNQFKVEKDTHAVSEINALDQFKLLADAMNKIKSMIQQAKTMQDSVKQHVDWYNTRVEILNKAKKECGFDYKDLVAIDMKDLENLITCDPTLRHIIRLLKFTFHLTNCLYRFHIWNMRFHRLYILEFLHRLFQPLCIM